MNRNTCNMYTPNSFIKKYKNVINSWKKALYISVFINFILALLLCIK